MVVIKGKKKIDDNIKAVLGEWNDANSSSIHYMYSICSRDCDLWTEEIPCNCRRIIHDFGVISLSSILTTYFQNSEI